MAKVIDKRVGRKTIRQRIDFDQELVLPSYSLEDTFQIFLNVKKANNLKDRTLRDYEKHLYYFANWMKISYGETSINEINIHILREYVL